MSALTPIGGQQRTTAAQSGWSALFWPAFRRSRNGMILLDERRRYVEVNGACLELLGYRRADLIGRPVSEFVEGGPVLSAEEWRVALAQPRFSGTAALVRADGRRITVDFAGHPASVDGQPLVLVVALKTGRGHRREGAARTPTPGALTDREREVVHLLALGARGPEIAAELHVSHHTVRTHVRNAMLKLGARSRAQLVAIVLAEGHTVDEAP